jgi:hypothetical protein
MKRPSAGAPRVGASLLWSPLFEALGEQARARGGLRVIVTPFASSDAMGWLIGANGEASDLKVVCRWSAADIASGIADLRVYQLLRERGIKLYLHPNIHLKLYVFADGTAFHSSANATGKGLGLSATSNIEVGGMTVLGSNDWDQLFALFDDSVLVDDDVFECALEFQRQHRRESLDKLPELVLAPSVDRDHSISSLPVSPSPDVFVTWHIAPEKVPPTDVAAYAHDRFLFRVPRGLDKRACMEHVGMKFKSSAFVKDIVALIKEKRSAHFGLVKEWLVRTCSDRPVPYRWELTANTRVLYDWLAFFFDEITWDQPHQSMVIRWKAEETGSDMRPERKLGRRRTRRRSLERARFRR